MVKQEEELVRRMNRILNEAELIISEIKEAKFDNTQWALDWMDTLNKLSVEF